MFSVLVHAPPEKLGKEKIEKLRAVVASHVGCDVGLLRDKDIKNVGNVVQQRLDTLSLAGTSQSNNSFVKANYGE